MRNLNLTTLDLAAIGFKNQQACYHQLSPETLISYALEHQEGVLTDTGALAIDTGEFTGRSPKDRFIVHDELTAERVWWGDVNIPFSQDGFDRLLCQVIDYLSVKPFFVREAMACADDRYQLSLRVITESASQNLFAYNLFLRPAVPIPQQPEWTVIAAPSFRADPEEDHTRQHNFSIINFTKKIILIGGTAYTGEIKKAVFSVLNFLLPQHGVLPMHCAANIGKKDDTAIFFGLSGTGKTTLSADPQRRLIGDDEHGWSDTSVFNFEGGCYAKTVNLSAEKEPQIYAALKAGALLENVCFYNATRRVNFDDITKTENTRLSYPITFIPNAVQPSIASPPRNIFLLSADAFGVLPPIAKLYPEQALYYFTLGYTAKVAGTEYGIKEPQATFSACFGKAFLPLHPLRYAEMLGEKIKQNQVNIWLVNTGWIGGPYGIGERISLTYTRAMIQAALNNELHDDNSELLAVFDLLIPKSCPGVPDDILNPVSTWKSPFDYWLQAHKLAGLFKDNYNRITDQETSNLRQEYFQESKLSK